jgi:hypothetical protein
MPDKSAKTAISNDRHININTPNRHISPSTPIFADLQRKALGHIITQRFT